MCVSEYEYERALGMGSVNAVRLGASARESDS
jgi:hypothetical protein